MSSPGTTGAQLLCILRCGCAVVWLHAAWCQIAAGTNASQTLICWDGHSTALSSLLSGLQVDALLGDLLVQAYLQDGR